jgi:hypothetical protein
MRRRVLLFYLVASLLLAGNAQAQTARRFIGMWKLVSIVDAKGQPTRGTQPTGFIVYDASGNMAVQIMPSTPRPKYAAAVPTPDEAKAALTNYTAYFGTWTVDEKAGTVTHHLEGSVNPSTMGDDNVRKFVFGPGDRLTLISIAPTNSGNRLTWERVK